MSNKTEVVLNLGGCLTIIVVQAVIWIGVIYGAVKIVKWAWGA